MGKAKCLLIGLLVLCFHSASVQAVNSDSKLTRWIKGFQWQQIKGSAIDLDASAQDVVYVVGSKNRVYRWRQDRGWRLLPGYFSHIAVDASNKPWAIDLDGQVRRYNGLWWDIKGDNEAHVSDVAASTKGAVFILDSASKIKQWNKSAWLELDPDHDWGTEQPIRIAVDNDNMPWVVTLSHKIYRYKDKQWQQVAGEAVDLAIGMGGIVLKTSADGAMAIQGSKGWLDLPKTKAALVVAVGAKGAPWYLDENGNLLVAGTFHEAKALDKVEQVKAVVPQGKDQSESQAKQDKLEIRTRGFTAIADRPKQTTEIQRFSFTRIKKSAAQDISIGADGSVFIAATDGQLQRWSNGRKQLLDFPGVLKKVAVDAFGSPWGINPQNEVFRIFNNRWTKVKNIKAADIAVGSRGPVYIVTLNDAVYRFNVTFKRFEKVHGIFATQIALDENSELWTLRSDNRVYFCPERRCKPVPTLQAKDIAIGPEGSVFAVALNNRLHRYNKATQRWDFIRKNVKQLSVGPEGFPWTIESGNSIWYSALFERDEDSDQRLALNVRGNTVEAAASTGGITIVRAPRFTQVNNPSGLLAGAPSFELFSGASGEVFVLQTVAGSGDQLTWVNKSCLDSPMQAECAIPSLCQMLLPSVPNRCKPCNILANQNGVTCSSTANNVPPPDPGVFINGYCLINPTDPECVMQSPGNSAGGVDCLFLPDPNDLIHTVCVGPQNGLQTAAAAGIAQSKAWQYDSSRKRFDGVSKLPSGVVVSLLTDQDERLWVNTTDEKVHRENNPGSGSFKAVTGTVPSTAGSVGLQLGSGDKQLHNLNSAGELFVYSDKKNRFERIQNTLQFNQLNTDNQGLPLVVRNNNLFRIDGNNVDAITRPLPQSADVIRASNSGTLYIIHNSEIKRFNATNKRFDTIRFSYGTPRSIAVDSKGLLWVSTTAGKIYRQL